MCECCCIDWRDYNAILPTESDVDLDDWGELQGRCTCAGPSGLIFSIPLSQIAYKDQMNLKTRPNYLSSVAQEKPDRIEEEPSKGNEEDRKKAESLKRKITEVAETQGVTTAQEGSKAEKVSKTQIVSKPAKRPPPNPEAHFECYTETT